MDAFFVGSMLLGSPIPTLVCMYILYGSPNRGTCREEIKELAGK